MPHTRSRPGGLNALASHAIRLCALVSFAGTAATALLSLAQGRQQWPLQIEGKRVHRASNQVHTFVPTL